MSQRFGWLLVRFFGSFVRASFRYLLCGVVEFFSFSFPCRADPVVAGQDGRQFDGQNEKEKRKGERRINARVTRAPLGATRGSAEATN